MKTVYRTDLASFGKARKLDNGSLVVPANITRSGIFVYKNLDGTERREYRPPTEVFDSKSLETYQGVPVVRGHPGDVTPENWKSVATGHVQDVARADDYLAALVRIDEASAIKDIEAGLLKEISMGYVCEYEDKPGTINGQHYDGIQSNIRINHLGMGGANWGRAGSNVRFMMDGKDFEVGTLLVQDGRLGSRMTLDEALTALGAANEKLATESKRADAAESAVKTANDQVAKLQGQLDAQKTEVTNAQDKLKAVEDGLSKRVDARVALLDQAKKVCGKDFKAEGKSDLEIKKEVISKIDSKMTLEGRADSYVDGAFETLVARWDGGRQSVNDAINQALTADLTDKARTDGSEDLVAAAQKRMQETNAKLFKPAEATSLNHKAVNLQPLGMKA